jgi:hypothetical protein
VSEGARQREGLVDLGFGSPSDFPGRQQSVATSRVRGLAHSEKTSRTNLACALGLLRPPKSKSKPYPNQNHHHTPNSAPPGACSGHAQLGIPETAHGPTLEYRQLPQYSSTHALTH